ncbi:unnamed protein product [Aureobasidium vineae]|uniref:Uncharacterized protein n=1 Tax=Aureobasidium vineae TaxID=2773715 RepID=A0A9N8J9J7_9PEZI|nr:unnamed protein product [Aureobasidium vineae]
MDNHETNRTYVNGYVYNILVRADELYDKGALEECMRLLQRLVDDYDMGMLPKTKTLILPCMLVDD